MRLVNKLLLELLGTTSIGLNAQELPE